MMSYNVILEFTHRGEPTEALEDALLETLGALHPALGVSQWQHARATVTVDASTLAEALATAVAAAQAVDGVEVLTAEVMPTELFDIRLGGEGDLLSVTEVAEHFGVTRQAILDRVKRGTLPSMYIGGTIAIPKAAIGPGQ